MASRTRKRKSPASETTAPAPAKRNLQSSLRHSVPPVKTTVSVEGDGGAQGSRALSPDGGRVRTTEDPGCSARGDGDGSLEGPVCFRISGIPPGWCKDTLEQALKAIDPELVFKDAELSELFPASSGTSQTALLNLNCCTAYFGSFERNEQKHEVIQLDGSKARLAIDKHFYDLTPMNKPESPIIADVIAITGLGGHAFGSWRSRSQTGRPVDRPMWLRDFLPGDFANARIMTYGYDSSLVNPNQARLTDYQRNFTECLYNARRNCPKRPIIFIGHSMGGLLVVQTLVEWSQHSKYHSIRDCIRGIFFFGTPHQGLRTVELSEMVDETADDNKVQNLLAQLEEGSEFLEDQKNALSQIWSNFSGKVFTFYETERTNSVKKVGAGVFSRMGDPVQMVQRLSAQLYLPNEHRFPIQSNHTDMVKFDSPQDRTYQTVVTRMEECMEQRDRDRIIKTIRQSAKEQYDYYFIDQNHHLRDLSGAPNLENDGSFFWVLRNLDYSNWARNEKVQVLVFRGAAHLKDAAAHVVRTLQGNEGTDLLLYFFYDSARSTKRLKAPRDLQGSDPKDLFAVWTLLRQVIDTHPQAQQQCLLEVFLGQLLNSIDNTNLAKIQTSPTAFKTLMCLSTLEVLWAALGEALSKAAELSENIKPDQQNTPRKKRNLTFVFNLDSLPREAWQGLVGKIRLVIKSLQQDYSTVKFLITNPPVGELDLQQPSEVLVQYDKERQDCLKTLYFKNSRYDKISAHYEHTFKWLWQTPEYNSWNSLLPSSPGLILIEGKPGSGKSTLLRYFKHHFVPPSDTSSDKAIVVSFFYSYRDGESERNHRNMLQALLYQILTVDETFFIHFQQIYRQIEGGKIGWSPGALKSILRACTRHPLQRRLFLIVDAMDESDCTDRADIIQFLQSLSDPTENKSGCVIKVFLGSRPINEFPDHWPRPCRIILQEKNKKDIGKYTHAVLQNQVFDSNESFKKQMEDYIVENSVGVFLWVRLVIDELVKFAMKGARQKKILEFLESLPKELESYYEHMLQGLNSDDPEDIRDGKRILQFCFFSHRAVELIELDNALAIPGQIQEPEPDFSSLESGRSPNIRRLVTHCVGSFVDIKGSTTQVPGGAKAYAVAQVMHQTVREFFLRPHDSVRLSHLNVTNVPGALMMIQLTCIRYLQIHYEEVILKFKTLTSGWDSEDFRNFVQYLDTRPLIKYSLECFTQDQGDLSPGISERLSGLIASVKKSPLSLRLCLLERLTMRGTYSGNIQGQVNHLLRLAAKEGYATAVGNLLAIAAASDSVDGQGRTCLHLAATRGHGIVVAILLNKGTAINTKELSGLTALHCAALHGYKAIVQLLLDHGADIFAKDNGDKTTLHYAAQHGHEATVQLLLDRGADIFAKDNGDMTTLHCAALNGHKATVQLLLDRGADIFAKDNGDKTTLHWAALNGHEATVQLLLDRGADIFAKDNRDKTALYWAAQHGHEATVQLLLDRGADFFAKDNGNGTALH